MGIAVPPAAQRLRALLLELERMYNHVADLGALANDVGFGLANSHAGRIREELLRINESVTGHRLLRGAVRPGSVRLVRLPDLAVIDALAADVADLAASTLAKSVVHERFSGTGVLSATDAAALGCLGPAARASGLPVDARLDQPFADVPVPERSDAPRTGDVLARFTVRTDEFAASARLVRWIAERAEGLTHRAGSQLIDCADEPRSGVGIVEGWRGTVVHRIETDRAGRLTRAKVVDPSWFNWPAIPVALADTIVPDFPLVNKSFNLSYAGNDL
jgi:Ni,Fe-hydrogenase III large subunit